MYQFHQLIKKIIYLLSISFLVLSACAAVAPNESENYLESDLVELIKLDSTLKLDIRYATANNFAGRAVYTEARAFLQGPAALAVVEVNKELTQIGYSLIIFDGYRPWSVTKLFWDITPDDKKKFVADPEQGSRHNRGCAVDLTLFDIASGKAVEMTSEFDEMSERSYPNYVGGTIEQRRLRDLLISKMQSHGFTVYETEWWHFDYKDWKSYRIENIQFNEIK